MILAHGQILSILKEAFPLARVKLADRSFETPSIDWIENEFGEWFERFLFNMEIEEWDNQFDCDDFSRTFAALSQISHFRAKKTNAEGILIGEIWYQDDEQGRHAINIAYDSSGEFHFIEPQTRKLINLTENEKQSAYEIRF